ncbi:MAG TPA: hypothetical protein VKU80_18410 [Planctomycetota bacterium]|nr:hypothetical protein [Planctomycetota bacterium]
MTITDTATGKSREIPLGQPAKKGWNDLVLGWGLGTLKSCADITLDEPLEGADLGIYFASNHMILSGTAAKGSTPPEISFADSPERAKAETGAKVYFRFDGSDLRIGRHILRWG